MALFPPYVLILVPLVLFVGDVYGGKLPFSVGEGEKGCDLFRGKWVRDDVTRPLYQESQCPYIEPALTCQAHGRPDKEYLYWKWQPTGCSLASFNASLVLETLRGKRMMYVGDSLSKGQYYSMICLLQSIIPKHSKTLTTKEQYTVFEAKDYNATIEHYWAPYLLESNSDGSDIHNLSDRVVRKDSINQYGDHWKGVDIMVLDTYIWWMVGEKINILEREGSFNDKVQKIVPVVVEDAYRMGMKNMLKWVKKNMDPKKTRVFFMSMSPTHMRSSEWGGDEKGNCYNETRMIQNSTYWGSSTRKSIMQVIKEEFSQSKYPIELLNITQLSNYRKDAHTSIYKEQHHPLTPQQLANPVSYADCIHYCLPGLQDIWNEILFTKIFYP